MSILRFAKLQKEDPRFCQARLQLLVDTLPVTTYFNPLGVVIAAAAMYLARAELGAVPFPHVMVAAGAHLLVSAWAYFIWQRYRSVSAGVVVALRRQMIGLQAVIGLAWGVTFWSFWLEGNAANNAFATSIMAMALWAMVLTRCSVRTVFLTGVLSVALPMSLRYLTSAGVTAHVLLALTPLWLWYMVFCGMTARDRVNEMLKARFTNEDMGRELTAARDEAVAKRKEAEEASQSKTAFLANMSHELRTPLNAIIGFSEIIAFEALGPKNPRYPEYAGDILSSGTHLLGLINEILDVAKIEAGRMEIELRPLDLAAMLTNIERIMSVKAAEKSLMLHFHHNAPAHELLADERAVRQIMLNLISNAVKYTPQGGRIDVACRAENGGIVLSVGDNGPGIPAEKLKLLFQPFAQSDNRYDNKHGGTGLGLALVQGLARLHGGRAWIESEVGNGTTAFVYFPLGAVKDELTCAAQ